MLTILLSGKTANLFNIKTQNKQGGGPELKRTARGVKEIEGKREKEGVTERKTF